MKRKRSTKTEKHSDDTVTTPATFRELSNLSNTKINHLSRTLGVNVKGKRNHKLTVIAKELNLSTNSENVDPFLATIEYVRKIQDGWTTDIRQVPDICLPKILNYLLASHDITVKNVGDFELYSEQTLKCYKATRSFDLWDSGHISGLQFNSLPEVDGFCAVKCLSNPSFDTSGTQYNTIVIFKECGEPVGATCLCVAGLGEACTHVAGLMFALEDFVSRGYRFLPDSQSTTEKLCRWTVPRGTKVIPKSMKKVDLKQGKPGKKFRASEYNPVPEHLREVNPDHLERLHASLCLVSPNVPWMTSAPSVLSKRNNSDIPAQPPLSELDNVIPWDCVMLVPSKEQELPICAKPLTLSERLHFSEIKPDLSLSIPAEEVKSIELLTRGQSTSADWHMYRKGMLTASMFHRVKSNLNQVEKNGKKDSTDKLVDSLINGSKFSGNASTKYGIKNEPKAADMYLKHMEKEHEKSRINECGLVVSKKSCYIGASPDRILTCDCHGQRLVEIKCPHNCITKDMSVHDLDFVIKCGTDLHLKATHPYYSQIQGQMGVTGITTCDLVIFDGKGIHIVNVKFNELYWEDLESKLQEFFKQFMMPELIKNKNGTHYQFAVDEHYASIQKVAREEVQKEVSEISGTYFCGVCKFKLVENVTDDLEASINCECNCACDKWFHWKCVQYTPDPDNFDVEPAWYCSWCMANCEITF